MKKVSKTLLLSLGVTVPLVASPVLMLSSCSQVWGYNTPLQFGSTLASGEANPFYNFKGQTILDGNGNNMVDYLQSSYSIDSRTGTSLAYSRPVTKWTYTKEEAEGKESQLMPINLWEHKKSGWLTSSSSEFSNNYSFKGTKDADKHITYINNENVIQAANIDFTSSLVSTISGYLTAALKYQSSQIGATDETGLNIAWGNAENFMSKRYTLTHGTKDDVPSGTPWEDLSDAAKLNNDFYEFNFAQANTHVTSKNNHKTFLRTTSTNINYDNGYFPIPSYSFSAGTKVDISETTKKLLLGPTADGNSKWCRAGKADSNLLTYYTSKTDGTQTLEYEKDVDGKTVNLKLKYTDYVFENVPVLLTVKDLTQRWINPTLTNSYHVRDYYVNDHDTVKNSVGKMVNIDKNSNHDGYVDIKEYKFSTPTSDQIQVTVKPSKVGEKTDCFDTRIIDKTSTTLNGNKFIALVTYAVREFDNDAFIYKNGTSGEYTEDFKNIMSATKMSDTETIAYLRSHNTASLNGTGNVFPAFLLNVYDNLFVKSYTAKDDTIADANRGYIISSTEIAKHNNALIGLLNRTTAEGYKSDVTKLTQDSKNLLAFLRYMFATNTGNTINWGTIVNRNHWKNN